MHKLVVEKRKRVYMMKASHDNLGNQGFYVMKTLIAEGFWWPKMEHDISWFCKTCHCLPGITETVSKNTTSSYTHTINFSSTACGHHAYVAQVKQLWLHSSWKVWYELLDGRSSSKGQERLDNWTLVV